MGSSSKHTNSARHQQQQQQQQANKSVFTSANNDYNNAYNNSMNIGSSSSNTNVSIIEPPLFLKYDDNIISSKIDPDVLASLVGSLAEQEAQTVYNFIETYEGSDIAGALYAHLAVSKLKFYTYVLMF